MIWLLSTTIKIDYEFLRKFIYILKVYLNFITSIKNLKKLEKLER